MCGVCVSVSGITTRRTKIKDKGFSSRNPNCADFPTALREFYELPDHGEAREDATIEVVGEQTEEESTREALHDVTLGVSLCMPSSRTWAAAGEWSSGPAAAGCL